MNYNEARVFIDTVSAKGNLLGLDSITCLMAELGNPQNELKFIHVAGTNGKGSVMSFMEQVLIHAGYKVGRYLSPVLHCYEEKIQINGTYIPKEDLARLMSRIRDAMEAIERRGEPGATVFEVETALSFLYFAEQKCDLVLLETGMGGAQDATNIVTTTVMEVLTSISLDHMEFLGDTVEKIARVKAGIIKPGTLVASADQNLSALEVIGSVCAQQGAAMRVAKEVDIRDCRYGIHAQSLSYGTHENIVFHLSGAYQIMNAALALEALDGLRTLGYRIPEQAIRDGFEATRWHGRFQIIHQGPTVIVDGAHNPDAALQLRRSLDLYFPDKTIYYIFGVFSDKEYDKIIRTMFPRPAYTYTVETKDNVRALPARELMRKLEEYGAAGEAVGDVPTAIEKAMKRAKPEDVIVLFGSLSWLWEAQTYFGCGD